jgi:hypothetical protein
VIRRALACLVLIAGGVAHADGEKVLVLRAEGRADKKIRARIEGAVLKLAQSGGQPTTAGDVTFGDAAMMVGCKAEEEKCKEEVLGMLAVDEIVTITATPKPGGIEVAVRRIGKTGGTAVATRDAATLVTPDKAEQLEALAPLFGGAAPMRTASPPTPVRAPAPVAATTTTPYPPAPVTTTAPPPPIEPVPIAPAPTTTATMSPMPGAAGGPIDEPRDDGPGGSRRVPMIGMAAGGALLVVGVVFWASAAGIEGDIDKAPKGTRAELEHVQDLEAEGDAYATTGNLLAIGGLILGGVSTYYFLKRGKRTSSRTARVTPIHGNGNGSGIAITWGGSL